MANYLDDRLFCPTCRATNRKSLSGPKLTTGKRQDPQHPICMNNWHNRDNPPVYGLGLHFISERVHHDSPEIAQ